MSKVVVPSQKSEKQKYKITNWASYNKSLINRGNLTFYLSEDLSAHWYSEAPAQQGGQYEYSDLCIETLYLIKCLFKLPYRQTEGFAHWLLPLMHLSELAIPSYSQICRRVKSLKIKPYKLPKEDSVVIAIDSTGLKIYGEGEWKTRKHGPSKRRTWRKLHLGVDVETGFILCHELTKNSKSDGSQFEPLLGQVESEVEEVSADGAYDQVDCWDYCYEKGIKAVIPPRENAIIWYLEEEGDYDEYPRNQVIFEIEEKGKKKWKIDNNYHKRSLSETAMFRFKTIHGGTLFSRKIESQVTETAMKIKLLNTMTGIGMPVSQPC